MRTYVNKKFHLNLNIFIICKMLGKSKRAKTQHFKQANFFSGITLLNVNINQ
jgi:hypothetical protein